MQSCSRCSSVFHHYSLLGQKFGLLHGTKKIKLFTQFCSTCCIFLSYLIFFLFIVYMYVVFESLISSFTCLLKKQWSPCIKFHCVMFNQLSGAVQNPQRKQNTFVHFWLINDSLWLYRKGFLSTTAENKNTSSGWNRWPASCGLCSEECEITGTLGRY